MTFVTVTTMGGAPQPSQQSQQSQQQQTQRRLLREPAINVSAYATKFAGSINDSERVMTDISGLIATAIDTAIDLEESGEKDQIIEMDRAIQSFLDMRADMDFRKTLLEEMKRKCSNGDQAFLLGKEKELKDYYEETLARRKAEYAALSEKEKYYKNESYRDYKQRLWEVHHPKEVMPVWFLMGRNGENDGDDEDGNEQDNAADEEALGDEMLLMTQSVNLICPLTRKLMEDPYTSKTCGHSYSKAILGLFRQENIRIECPITGCKRFLYKRDLAPNKALKRQVERALLEQEAEREEEEGEDNDYTVVE